VNSAPTRSAASEFLPPTAVIACRDLLPVLPPVLVLHQHVLGPAPAEPRRVVPPAPLIPAEPAAEPAAAARRHAALEHVLKEAAPRVRAAAVDPARPETAAAEKRSVRAWGLLVVAPVVPLEEAAAAVVPLKAPVVPLEEAAAAAEEAAAVPAAKRPRALLRKELVLRRRLCAPRPLSASPPRPAEAALRPAASGAGSKGPPRAGPARTRPRSAPAGRRGSRPGGTA
jgi:hypothetical protein